MKDNPGRPGGRHSHFPKSRFPDNPLPPDQVAESGGRAPAEDLDATLADRRKHRDFMEESWFYRVRIAALVVCTCAALAFVGVYLWHLLLPESLRWLSEVERERLEKAALTIIVGVVCSLSATYFFGKK